MQLKLTSPPEKTPVSLTEAKLHLRVEHAADDTLITALIAAATTELDGRFGRLRRAILTQTWDMYECGFPNCCKWELPMPPLQQVVSVKYYDGFNVQQTLDAVNYEVITADFVGYIKLKPGRSWPATYEREDAVDVQFKCGFGDDLDDQQAPLKAAILLRIGDLYVNRGDNAAPGANAMAIESLVAPFRLVTVV